MLSALRNAAGTWVAKLLLLLLVVSFAVWGISGQVATGFGGNSVVAAGGTSVTPIEYRLAYDRQIAVLSQQFGTRLTREQARGLGVEDQVLAQLVAGAVLDEQASELGLGLSQDKLAQLTMSDPAFQGPDGRFSRQQFEYVLRQIGMRPEDYLQNRGQVAIRQQIVEAVSDGMKAPDTFLRAVALYRGEDRTAEYIVLPKSLVEPIEEPSDAVLSTYFDENKQIYAAPEYRKIAYVTLVPENITDESAVSDEQVKEDYEKNIDRFTTPETRTIEQLVFPSKDAAQTALDSIRAGATFDSIVTAQGKTAADTLLGTFAKDKVPDPAVAEAAFALQANEVSQIVDGAFGPVLVRVTSIAPAVVKSLAEATPEIRKDLALAEANRILLDVHDNYEDSRAAGESLREAAGKLGLKVMTVDAIDRAAQRPDGTVVNDLPQSKELLAAAFETEAGIENPAVNVGSTGYVFFEVEDIVPARERTLDEVKDKVVADWKEAEAENRLTAKAGEIEKRLKDGTSLDTLATELSLEKHIKRGLKREADDADFGRAGVAAIFGGAEGSSGLVAAPTGDAQIVFKVTEVFEPAGADANSVPEDAQASFASGMADDLLDQLVAKLQSEYGVTVNRSAIEQALAF
ncbi:peptidylprolyl isomerase [Mesorhizobium sp. YM1C-6-2]|uniref:peptidylprolyl isomerase n=1 Tax=Mesorhizobium sp. YM1C-6-2 TaxID=1827501 RepID=UPI000EF1CB87|nr:peptidylprolyl isomerase [Mesorhizobium sp. YM1C-6-2]RLP23448.1 peptidylprolyl isomerase [Mesorhizobium sp. YM1C-6-2]